MERMESVRSSSSSVWWGFLGRKKNLLVTEFLVLTMVIVGLFLWYKRRRRLNILERNGILGPKPSMFRGNFDEFKRLPNVIFDGLLISRYGTTCGYYLGAKPVILTSDPDLLMTMQKKFSALFLDRPRKVPGGINPDPKRQLMLGNLPVPEWEVMRNIMRPAFSSGKLKCMLSSLEGKVKIFLEKISQAPSSSKENLDLYPLFQTLTLDIIGRTAFGLDLDLQNNRNEKLESAIRAEFSKNFSNNWLTQLYLSLPELTRFLRPIRELLYKLKMKLGRVESPPLWETAREALQRARESHQLKQDEDFGSCDLLHHFLKDKSGLSDGHILANTLLIFEAAYETTSCCLAFMVHLLIHHLDCQERIRQEIWHTLKEHGSLESYGTLQNLKFLEACILETLRLYPPQTTFIGRSAAKDVPFLKDGKVVCTIPKGVHVQAALFQIHRDPTHWTNPSEFLPERFLGENSKQNEYFYQAFGKGKRQCIGMGFALMSIKYIMATILSKYELFPSESSEDHNNIEITYKVATMTPTNGSFARLVPVMKQ